MTSLCDENNARAHALLHRRQIAACNGQLLDDQRRAVARHVDDHSLDAEIASAAARCADLREHVVNMAATAQRLEEEAWLPALLMGDRESAAARLVEAQETACRVEIERLRSRDPDAVKVPPVAVAATRLAATLEQTTTELVETIQAQVVAAGTLRRQLETARRDLDEHTLVGELLDKQITEKSDVSVGMSAGAQSAELARQLRVVARHNEKLLLDLSLFVKETFPALDRHDRAEGDKYDQLRRTLTMLFAAADTRSAEYPLAPYIDVGPDTNVAPMYVELLVRAGIAVRHPEFASRVMVVSFAKG